MKMLAAQVLDRLQFASVSRKLSIGFGVVVLFSALIVTGTWLAGSLTIANAHSLVYEQAPIERAVRNWQTSSVKMSEIALRSTLTRGGGDVFNLSLQVHGLMKEEDSLLESITSMADASDYRAQILPVLQSAKQQRGKYIAFRADIIQKALEEKIITQRDLRDHETEMRLYLGAINNVLSLAEKISKESAEKMMLSARGVQAFSAFSFFIIILLSATSIWILRKSIVDRLAEVSRVAMDIARGGDLGHRIPDVPACGDEIVTMANSFNAMVEQVESGARVIRKKSNDMAAMLKTMPQGLLTIDANNVVQPEYSAHLAAILETDEIAGRSVMGLVFADTTLSSDTLSQVEAIAGACVGEDAMNFTFNRHLLVPEVEKVMPDGRTKVLELTWSAIVNEEDVTEQILLCIRDVTELRQLSQEAAALKKQN